VGSGALALTSAEAARRLAEYGPNEPVHVHRLSAVVQLLQLFANPLVVILLVASAVSASLGQAPDALIIITIVLVGIGINFWQTYRSQQAADRLRASVAPTATVERDARWQEIPLRAVVPADLIRLSAGDLVPAAGARLRDPAGVVLRIPRRGDADLPGAGGSRQTRRGPPVSQLKRPRHSRQRYSM